MTYDPGTLLVVKEEIVKCKVDYFRTWIPTGAQSYNYGSKYLTHPYVNKRREFTFGDNVFIVDYFSKLRYEHDRQGKVDFYYRVWINGQECVIRDDVLEMTAYYEVVK